MVQEVHNAVNNSGAVNDTSTLQCCKQQDIDTKIIINKFVHEAMQQLGKHIQRIVLYGSYARKEESENSDIDILLLVDLNNIEIKEVQNDIYDLAFELELSTGKEISPIIINMEQFQYWKDTLPFYRNIEKEGVIVI